MGRVVEELLTELDGIIVGDVSFVSFKSAMNIFDEYTMNLVIAEANGKTEEVEHFSTRVIVSLTVATEILQKVVEDTTNTSEVIDIFDRIVCTYSSEINRCIISDDNYTEFKDDMLQVLNSLKTNNMDLETLKKITTSASNHLLEAVSEYASIKEVLDLVS